ncbi:hypothetical protein IQ226_22015 [Dolichospermum sp. LEGE 00240]|nr:hypothetical protein [Dolichospermum sp. LEGE 00240]MBE9251734.1 hypothetical protein [Dolichospermum sp. LEGE 00240]
MGCDSEARPRNRFSMMGCDRFWDVGGRLLFWGCGRAIAFVGMWDAISVL